MPKAFSENEKRYIRQRLMEEARICLDQFGVRKTTVDELVKRANIPKGTFYLFYDSKELLFFDVFSAFHDEIHSRLLSEIAVANDKMSPAKLTHIILGLYRTLGDSFMLSFLTNGEMERLIRKLPPEVAQSHAEEDDIIVDKLLFLVPNMKADKSRVFSAALRGVFLSMLYKQEIGEDVFDEALEMLIHGVVMQMFEGEEG
jgi:AcrR family transcriptional regulator